MKSKKWSETWSNLWSFNHEILVLVSVNDKQEDISFLPLLLNHNVEWNERVGGELHGASINSSSLRQRTNEGNTLVHQFAVDFPSKSFELCVHWLMKGKQRIYIYTSSERKGILISLKDNFIEPILPNFLRSYRLSYLILFNRSDLICFTKKRCWNEALYVYMCVCACD